MGSVRQRRLYSAVAALVRRMKTPHETVWHWSESRPGEVAVMLIHGRRVRGRDYEFHGGCGRSLHFRKVNSRWVLAGRGQWRT